MGTTEKYVLATLGYSANPTTEDLETLNSVLRDTQSGELVPVLSALRDAQDSCKQPAGSEYVQFISELIEEPKAPQPVNAPMQGTLLATMCLAQSTEVLALAGVMLLERIVRKALKRGVEELKYYIKQQFYSKYRRPPRDKLQDACEMLILACRPNIEQKGLWKWKVLVDRAKRKEAEGLKTVRNDNVAVLAQADESFELFNYSDDDLKQVKMQGAHQRSETQEGPMLSVFRGCVSTVMPSTQSRYSKLSNLFSTTVEQRWVTRFSLQERPLHRNAEHGACEVAMSCFHVLKKPLLVTVLLDSRPERNTPLGISYCIYNKPLCSLLLFAAGRNSLSVVTVGSFVKPVGEYTVTYRSLRKPLISLEKNNELSEIMYELPVTSKKKARLERGVQDFSPEFELKLDLDNSENTLDCSPTRDTLCSSDAETPQRQNNPLRLHRACSEFSTAPNRTSSCLPLNELAEFLQEDSEPTEDDVVEHSGIDLEFYSTMTKSIDHILFSGNSTISKSFSLTIRPKVPLESNYSPQFPSSEEGAAANKVYSRPTRHFLSKAAPSKFLFDSLFTLATTHSYSPAFKQLYALHVSCASRAPHSYTPSFRKELRTTHKSHPIRPAYSVNAKLLCNALLLLVSRRTQFSVNRLKTRVPSSIRRKFYKMQKGMKALRQILVLCPLTESFESLKSLLFPLKF